MGEGKEGKLSLFSSETSHPGFCKSKGGSKKSKEGVDSVTARWRENWRHLLDEGHGLGEPETKRTWDSGYLGPERQKGGWEQGLGASTRRTLGDSGGRTLKSCLDTLQENATCLPGRRAYYSEE